MLSPLHLPYLLLPPWYAPAVAKFVQMLVALAFTFLFLRRLDLGRPAALLGGVIYMNSAFLVVWTGFPHTEVAALIPALFWAVDRAIDDRTLTATLPVALVFALMLLHGFPAVTAYAGVAVGLYAVVRMGLAPKANAREGVKTTMRLGAAVVLGAGLAAVQLLPFASSLNEFDRSYRAQDTSSVLPLRSLATAAVPNAFGSPGTVDYAPTNPVEMQTFAGASTLVLMFGAMLRLPPRRFPRGVRWFLWAGVAVMIVLIYVGGPLLGALQKALSPVFAQNPIGRMRSVLGFFLAALAALGFEAFTASDRPPMSKAQRIAFGSVCVAALIAAIAGVRFLVGVAREAGQLPYFLRQLWIPGIVAGATVSAVMIGSRLRPGRRHPLILVAPVAFAVESLVFATGFLPIIHRTEFYPVTPTHRYLSANIGHERMAAEGSTMWPGTETYYKIRTVASHAFYPRPWLELLDAVGVSGPATQPQLKADEPTARSPIFDRLAAAFWVTRPEVIPYGRRVTISTGAGTVLLRPGAPLEQETSLEGIRAVIVDLKEAFSTSEKNGVIGVQLLARDGSVLAAGDRRIFPGQRPGQFHVALSEYRSVSGSPPATIRVAIRSRVSGVSLAASGGRPALSAILATDDGLRLVFTDGANVYRRLDALPRIRWAGRATVVSDPGERIRLLSHGVDTHTVVLDTPDVAGSGRPARVRVLEDSGDAIRVGVRAEGDGYLVIADSIQDGWRAEVDGRPARIVAADHALGAVRVNAGDHVVRLVYRPRAWRIGGEISIASLIVLVSCAIAGLARRRARNDGGRGRLAAPGDTASLEA